MAKKPISEETRKRLLEVAELFKGRTMFPEALARAKKLFKDLDETDVSIVKQILKNEINNF